MQPGQTLALHGVRVHNLKNIDVAIPRNRLTVVSGVSGAGKSSLVFDTLHAEAQRRYLQSFSVYTRQYLERFEKPDAESIGDLTPAIAIRGGAAPARGTVGTLTQVDAPLRVLFARAGTLTCPACGVPVRAQRAADAQAALAALPQGTRASIAFAAVAGEETALREEGYVRVRVGGAVYRLGEQALPPLDPAEPVWVLLDRIETGKTPAERVAESLDAAFRRGGGRISIITDDAERVFDERHACAGCGRVFGAPSPRWFDVEDPAGACPACKGTGGACPACAGARLQADALAVRLDGGNIHDWRSLSVRSLHERLGAQTGVLVEQMLTRLQALVALGLGHLTLAQPSATLSDGALRRIALAGALASDLVGVLYLIDEPTVGMHARDAAAIIDALTQLRNRGNTVVVVDNDRAVMNAADHVIDLGPGAGEEGGNITYAGPPSGLADAPEHPTSDFWTGRSFIEVPQKRRKPTGFLKLTGAGAGNLRHVDIAFPLGILCAVTGVTGSGKRSLVDHTLYRLLSTGKKPKAAPATVMTEAKISGANQVTETVLLDQSPLARGARSNPATYLKIFDAIRELFAATVDARIRNYGPGHFSFNQSGGRCESCEGQGTLTIDMQFLADVHATCPECQGRRYRKEILAIKVRSLNIAEVLDLTVREAFRFFRAQPAIEKKLKVLLDAGLDYLRLGQAMDTLSGSECQRMKLAGHLASSRKTGCLFLLIEPTAGLHPADVVDLLESFDQLLAAGHSLIVIENDLDVLASADWLIELGPGGGGEGGRIVAQGSPEQIAAGDSPTAPFLRREPRGGS